MLSQMQPAGLALQATGGGTIDWTNPTNVYADDDALATCGPIGTSEISKQLRCRAFGFTIPTHANICGVVVSSNCFADAANRVQDYSIQLLVAGNLDGDNLSVTSTFWATDTGTVREWGSNRTLPVFLTPALVNSTVFGVSIQITNNGLAAATASVDLVSMTIYYEQSMSSMGMHLRMGMSG